MIELFSLLLNVANLKTNFPESIKYEKIQELKKDHWSNFGPKQSDSQSFVLLSKVIQYEDYWYRVVVRFKRKDNEKMHPFPSTEYEVSGLAPCAIFKLSQNGIRFDIVESYRADNDDKISDYISKGVPHYIVEAAIKNLNYHLEKKED